MKRLKLVDQIVKEPVGGAHSNKEKAYEAVKNAIEKNYQDLKNLSPSDLVDQRMDKYAQMGVYKD